MARQSKVRHVGFDDGERAGPDDPEEDDNTASMSRPVKTLWMIDWIRGFKLGLFYVPLAGACCAFIAFFIMSWDSHGHPDQESRAIVVAYSVAFTGMLLGLVAIVVHFIGHVFDPARDRLTYPTSLLSGN
jgi:hypothetical protein